MKAMKIMTAEQLLRDLASHSMTVLLDNGVYRHLKFKAAKDSWNMWFEIITWPGSLTIKGDMGTWCFSRVDDMFTFFRSSAELKINASYWQEKIESESRFGGPSKKFQADIFKQSILDRLADYDEPESKAEIIGALEEEVFREEDESSARRALAEFKHEGFTFQDSWEISGHGYTYHFLWCLYAIVWGIQQYDAVRVGEAVAL